MLVFLSDEAKKDLVAIRQYSTDLWGKPKAKEYILDIQNAFNSIAGNPEIGIKRLDINPDARSLFVNKHAVYYSISKSKIIVFRILGVSMLPRNHLTF